VAGCPLHGRAAHPGPVLRYAPSLPRIRSAPGSPAHPGADAPGIGPERPRPSPLRKTIESPSIFPPVPRSLRRGGRGTGGTRRCLDFEREFGKLDTDSQTILLLAFREHQPHRVIAQIARCSERAISYKIPAALAQLARLLDRASML
jgi:hypothetical protein